MATGLRGAERRSVMTTPCTPAPSAVRSSAPRFCGSSTPSRARSSAGVSWAEEVLDVEEGLAADHGDDALVGGGLGHAGKVIAGLKAQPDPGIAAEVDQLLQLLVMTLFGHTYVVKLPRSRA